MTINVSTPVAGANLPYTEIALDPATWDLVVPKTLLRGPDAIIQRLRVRIGFWLGEWFLDLNQGVPYRERVFLRNPKEPTIVALFRKIIASTPGIMAVPACRLSPINRVQRSATISFVAKLSDGTTTITAVNEPFNVLHFGG